MASESQPPGVQEGSSTPPPPVASKEDQKTAAALSNMDTNGEDASGSASRKEVDTEALGKAMQNLSTKNGAAPPAAAKKAVVKVAAADVTLLVRCVVEAFVALVRILSGVAGCDSHSVHYRISNILTKHNSCSGRAAGT